MIARGGGARDKDAVRGIYNGGAFWEERIAMHQWWSDCLDQLRDGAPKALCPARP